MTRKDKATRPAKTILEKNITTNLRLTLKVVLK